jgi:hypothetical protein
MASNSLEELFARAEAIERDYLYLPSFLSSRVNHPWWSPTWHHAVHGGRGIIHADYRA